MPRKARIDAVGALHHIIIRGIECRKIFYDDSDRDAFVTRLGQVLKNTRTDCFAWALIPNHAHLLLRTGNPGCHGNEKAFNGICGNIQFTPPAARACFSEPV
jgi:REP element-mobilizing transposase RayT